MEPVTTAASPDLILQALSPRIVVFADDQVERSCQLNGCNSLDELFKPWQSTVERVPGLSSTLSNITHPSFTVRFTSHSTLLQSQFGGGGSIPYSAEIVADVVSNLVHSFIHEADDVTQYEILRDLLFASTPVDGQGTFNHPVCRLFAASTSDEAPLESLRQLIIRAGETPAFPGKSHIESGLKNSLPFYLLVHDVSVEGHDLARARQLFLQVKQRHGPHCGLLVINSSSHSAFQQTETNKPAVELDSDPPYHAQYAMALKQLSTVDPFTRLTDMLAGDVSVERSSIGLIVKNSSSETSSFHYARYLGTEDIRNIRDCIRELTVQSVIPWMEARVRQWNEIFLQSRKGIAGRLLGAGKKLFGGPAPTTSSSSKNGDTASYSAACYTTRRSADFAFMLRDYKSAMPLYDAIRQALAEEGDVAMIPDVVVMYGLSCLLSLQAVSGQRSTILWSQYVEIIIPVQRSVENGLLQYSKQLDLLRNLLSFVEIFAIQQRTSDSQAFIAVSKLLVTIAKNVVEEFSAILLQKAAVLDIYGLRRHVRKRAFHLTLAACQYEHFGHDLHSRRCFTAALHCLQSHTSSLWAYSQDFLQYTLGNQAYVSGNDLSATKHFSSLLHCGSGRAFQAGTLEIFRLAKQRMNENDTALESWIDTPPMLIFDVPRVIPPVTRVRCRRHGISATSAGGRSVVEGDVHNSCTPQRQTELLAGSSVVIADPFQVEVTITNVTNAPIELTCLHLSMSTKSGDAIDGGFRVHEVPCEVMLPLEKKKISFVVIPQQVVQAKVAALAYRLAGTIQCVHRFSRSEQRSSESDIDPFSVAQSSGNPMIIDVENPSLSLEYRLPDNLYNILNGESVPMRIQLSNRGDVTLQDVLLIFEVLDRGSSSYNMDFTEPVFTLYNPARLLTLAVNGVLHPTETRVLNIVLPVYGKGQMTLQILAEYTQQGSGYRAQISRSHPVSLHPSLASTVYQAPYFSEQHPSPSPLSLHLENLSSHQSFLLLRSTLAYRVLDPRKTSRTLDTIVRMHQLCRSHSSSPIHFRPNNDGTCSKLCADESFYPIVYPGAGSHLLSAAITVASDERRSAKSTMITVPPNDICVAQENIATDLTLKTSATEDFEGMPKQITLGLDVNDDPNGITIHHTARMRPRSSAAITKPKDYGDNTTKCSHLHQHLPYAGKVIIQLPHGLNLSSEVRRTCASVHTGTLKEFQPLQVRFTLRNDSHDTSMKWSLRTVDDSPGDASKTIFLGRTWHHGTLLAQERLTAVYLIYHERSVTASLGAWAIDWAHKDSGTCHDNTGMHCRFDLACDLC